MEICEQGEAYVDKGDNTVFDHIRVILRQGNKYSYARANWRILDFQPSAADISQLEINEIPIDTVWPPMDPSLTLAPETLPLNTFIERQSLLYYGDTPASSQPGRQVLNCKYNLPVTNLVVEKVIQLIFPP